MLFQTCWNPEANSAAIFQNFGKAAVEPENNMLTWSPVTNWHGFLVLEYMDSGSAVCGILLKSPLPLNRRTLRADNGSAIVHCGAVPTESTVAPALGVHTIYSAL